MLDIQAGEGGEDSRIFVDQLFSAYSRYAASKSLKIEILDSGIGHKTAKVSGSGAWKAFRHEPGKHCVQRVPPTERHGRKQTSMVSVAVLPLPEESKVTRLPESELEISYTTGTGPGGQHRNKTASCVRAAHTPTGIVVVIDGRDQHSNKRTALRILAARVQEHRQAKIDGEYGAKRREQHGGGGRGDKVRTYNFMESRVVDHRLGTKTSNVKEVMKGGFDLLFRR